MTIKGVPQLKLVNETITSMSRYSPLYDSQWNFYIPINVMWINIFVFPMPDIRGFCLE